MATDKPRRTSDVWVSQEYLDVVLRELRRRRQVTQKQIADEAQVSPAAIARLEKGDRRPSRSMLDKLAVVYQTTPEGMIEAAARIEQGADPDTALDGLPTVPADPPALAAEVSAMPAPPPPPAAPEPREPSPAQPRTRALAEQLTTLDEAAIDLLAGLASWAGQREDSPDDLQRLRRELDVLLSNPQQQRATLAAMPTGEVRYVFAHAIGTDEHGQLWIDPLTRARTAGYDTEDPRVERYDTGQIVVDATRLDRPSFGPRDPDRHRTKVTPPAPGSLEQLYASTVLELHWRDGSVQTVAPDPTGETDAALPDDISSVQLITAHNPRARLLRRSENQERNRLLHDDLTRAGLRVVDAVTRSPDNSWSEESFAVLDADTDTVLDLARRYEQTAILRWTTGRVRVVWTDPDAVG